MLPYSKKVIERANMLKRNQVLLNSWIVDHAKAIAKKYDVSFSEVIRLLVCLQACAHIKMLYPEYEYKIKTSDLSRAIRATNKKGNIDPEELHKFFSDIYFESRKAMEFWANKEAQKNSKASKKAKGD
jgi:RNase P subunit RPR2